jgi:lipoprotein-anchoring transpeptidase ErfK/SrfK
MPKKLLQWLFAILAGALLAAMLAPAPARAREMVPFAGAYYPGTIVIRTRERRLYFVLGQGYAIRYPVGVGRAGQQWTGVAYIDDMRVAPDWVPPPTMRRDPSSPAYVIPGGAPQNPMGAAALTLTGGEYAIHGTNQPQTIGGFVSNGCIRMHNEDVVDLFARVTVGTPVVVER